MPAIIEDFTSVTEELDMRNSNISAARLVRNMKARWTDEFNGVNVPALISHLAKVHAAGGVKALSEATGLKPQTVITLLRQAPGRELG